MHPIQTAPPPDDIRHRIAAEMIRAWRAARDLRDEAAELADSDPGLARWSELMTCATIDAERELLCVILAHDESIPPGRVAEALFEARPPRALEHDGRLYLAVSDPDAVLGAEGDEQVVRLAELDPAAIARPAAVTP